MITALNRLRAWHQMYVSATTKVPVLVSVLVVYCYSSTVCHTTEPPEPQSVTLSATGSDSIVMTWESPGDPAIISYTVYRQASAILDGHLDEDRNVNVGDDLRVKIGPLSPYTTYTYCVVAHTAYASSLPVCVSNTTLEAGILYSI